ncbi:TonB-dependent receptor [Alteromonas aestuariivivens]|uniref:TonB-dependent receptor n=1 Tax=Alteromonas aestuariivivens TaxID=1938339 RepID=UPI001C6985A3|nr:TonB-dependent receptor [Alteromonas aestuariivivens]
MSKPSCLINFRKSLTAIAMMSAFGSVHAQQADSTTDNAAQDDESQLEVIEVSGTRGNLLNAQNLKRNSDTVLDSITASDIGVLPDRSVLEAIQRLPGISIERFAGPDDPDHFSVEGSGAIIRGMTQTRSEFNGRDSFTANSGRGLSFQDVSPELMGGVDVYKNQTADMIEGGIGGTVSLRTRKPFDSQGRVIAIGGDYSYGDVAEKGSPTFSALYSDRWDLDSAGEFGLLVNYADSQLYGESHGIQSDAFVTMYARDLAGAESFVGENGEGIVWMPNASNLLKKFDDRERKGFASALQWESEDETLLGTLQYIRSDAKLSWHEQAVKYQGGYYNINERRTRPLDGTSFTFDDRGLFESGTLTQGVDGWRAGDGNADRVIRSWETGGRPQFGYPTQFDSRVKDTESLVEDLSFNLRWLASENLELTADFQYIDAETSDDDVVVHTAAFAGQTYDVTGSTPDMMLLEPYFGYRDANPEVYAGGVYPGFTDDPAGDSNYFQDRTSYFLRSAMDHYERSEGESKAFRLDGKYFLGDDSLFTSLQTGVRYAKREQTVRSTDWNWGSLGPEFSGSTPAAWLDTLPDDYQSNFEMVDWSDFHGGGVAHIPGDQTIHATEAFVRSVINGNMPYKTDAGDWVPYPNRTNVTLDSQYGIFAPGEINDTTEVNKAIYLRLNFEGGEDLFFSGNVGLRYVKLTREANGFINYPDLVPAPEFAAPGDLANQQLNPEIVTAWVNDQVAQGNYASFEDALQAEENRWIGEPLNYLPVEDRAFGDETAERQEAKTDFSMLLPSFNIKVELTDELIGRFAFSKAVAMPDIGDVRNRVMLGNDDVQAIRPTNPDPGTQPDPEDTLIQGAYVPAWTGEGGNPYLEPMESWQYDVALEWYFAEVGQLSVTLFHKDLRNYFIQGATPQSFTNPTTGQTQTALVNTTTNGGKGKMDGVEFAYQQFFDTLPAPWDGLGVQATFTYIDASGVPNNQIDAEDESWAGDSATDPGIRVSLDSIPLEGQSKRTFNLVGMYEKNGWSARLAYNWRSRYLLTTRDVISKAPLWYDDHGQLDGSLFYNINDNFTVGLQGTNLTNSQSETIMMLNNDGLEAGRSWFVSDRRIALVARANF